MTCGMGFLHRHQLIRTRARKGYTCPGNCASSVTSSPSYRLRPCRRLRERLIRRCGIGALRQRLHAATGVIPATLKDETGILNEMVRPPGRKRWMASRTGESVTFAQALSLIPFLFEGFKIVPAVGHDWRQKDRSTPRPTRCARVWFA